MKNEKSQELGERTWGALWEERLDPLRAYLYMSFVSAYVLVTIGMLLQLLFALARRTCADSNCFLFQLEHPLGLALHQRAPGWLQFVNAHFCRAASVVFVLFVVVQLFGRKLAQWLDGRAPSRVRDVGAHSPTAGTDAARAAAKSSQQSGDVIAPCAAVGDAKEQS